MERKREEKELAARKERVQKAREAAQKARKVTRLLFIVHDCVELHYIACNSSTLCITVFCLHISLLFYCEIFVKSANASGIHYFLAFFIEYF